MGVWNPTKPNKHPKLAVEVAPCHDAYNKIGLKTPTTTLEHNTTMVTATPDKGASMCLIGRCVTNRMGITRPKLKPTSKRLVSVNGGQIKTAQYS